MNKVETKSKGRPKKIQNDELDNKILECLKEGKTLNEIEEETGKSYNAILYRIKCMRERKVDIPEIKDKRIKTENDEVDNKILEGLIIRKKQKEIAKNLNITQQSISYRIIQMRKRDNKKLAKMIINLIFTKHASIEQVKAMGKYYGVELDEVLNQLDEHER